MDSVLPFDCYIYLEKNGKLLLWIQQGKPFLIRHSEKIVQASLQNVLVLNDQRAQFFSYIGRDVSEGLPEEAAKAGKASSVTVVSGDPQALKTGSESIHVKGSGDWAANNNNEAIHVKGAVKTEVAAPSSHKLKLDVGFLNPFIQATQEAFQELCNVSVKFKPPMPRKQKNDAVKIEVASLISLVSDSIRGNIGLCFPHKTFIFTMGEMTGQVVDEVTPDLVVGAGELIHFIFEKARSPLVLQGYPLERAVPTLVYGEELAPHHLITDPGFSIVFETPGGSFQFEVGIKTGS